MSNMFHVMLWWHSPLSPRAAFSVFPLPRLLRKLFHVSSTFRTRHCVATVHPLLALDLSCPFFVSHLQRPRPAVTFASPSWINTALRSLVKQYQTT